MIMVGVKSDDVVSFGICGNVSGVIVSVGVGFGVSYFEDFGVSCGFVCLWVIEWVGIIVVRWVKGRVCVFIGYYLFFVMWMDL